MFVSFFFLMLRTRTYFKDKAYKIIFKTIVLRVSLIIRGRSIERHRPDRKIGSQSNLVSQNESTQITINLLVVCFMIPISPSTALNCLISQSKMRCVTATGRPNRYIDFNNGNRVSQNKHIEKWAVRMDWFRFMENHCIYLFYFSSFVIKTNFIDNI